MTKKTNNIKKAFAYFRTSSAANVGTDKDSDKRQREAVTGYAKATGLTIEGEFYDAAVSGADPVNEREAFCAMLEACEREGVTVILVETANRFARDLAVQLAGHSLLQSKGIELIPVDAPNFFTDPSPTAVMVQQILGAVSQFEKASIVAKLKAARDRKREAAGRCEGRKPAPQAARDLARQLSRQRKQKPSLRQIAAALAESGHFSPSGKPYSASSVKCMLA